MLAIIRAPKLHFPEFCSTALVAWKHLRLHGAIGPTLREFRGAGGRLQPGLTVDIKLNGALDYMSQNAKRETAILPPSWVTIPQQKTDKAAPLMRKCPTTLSAWFSLPGIHETVSNKCFAILACRI